jgi:hypothetical protein
VRATELRDMLVSAWSETIGLYARLAPNGRKPTAGERAEILERLECDAVCPRTLDRDRDAIQFLVMDGQQTRRDYEVRPTIVVLRIVQRNLVLALSDDPNRRNRAIRIERLAALARPINDFWLSLPSREDQ